MEPSHLSDKELEYELNIRGVYDISDKRLATKTLRTDLINESKGQKRSTFNLSPLKGKPIIDELNYIVTGIIKEFKGAVERKSENVHVLRSKLLHYSGKVNRLAGSDANEVVCVEKMQRVIKDALSSTNLESGKSANRTGAIPKNNPIDRNIEVSVDALVTLPVHLGEAGAESLSAQVDDNAPANQDNAGGDLLIGLQPIENAQIANPNQNRSIFQNRSPLFERNDNSNQIEPIRSSCGGVGVADFDNIINNNHNERYRAQAPNPADFYPQNNQPSNRVVLPEYDTRRNYDFPAPNQFIEQQQRVENPIRNDRINSNTQANVNVNRQGNYFRHSLPPQDRTNDYSGYHQRRVNYNIGTNNNNRMDFQPRRRNQISDWNLTFSGDTKEISLIDFLSQVSLLARAEGMSDEELLRSAVYLFKGTAYTWYRAFYPYYQTWSQLVQGLRNQFLPVDYDFWLLKELEQRRQGDTENFGIYFAAMEMLFRNLSYRMSEHQKLSIVMRNMHPI